MLIPEEIDPNACNSPREVHNAVFHCELDPHDQQQQHQITLAKGRVIVRWT
jgi:hypothetical protein